MKKRTIASLAAAFGVFLVINTPLLAQGTGVAVKPEVREHEQERVRIEAERAARDHVGTYVFASTSSSEKNSKLTISKDYDGESTMKTGTFNVAEGVTRIRISISGFVKSGKIGLEVYLPGKKELQKLTIDDSANIEWSQSINIQEGDTKYFGEWSYVVNAENAKGFYSLSLNTY